MDNEEREPVVPETANDVPETAAVRSDVENATEGVETTTESTGDTAVAETTEASTSESLEQRGPESAQASKKPKGSAAKKGAGKQASVKGKKTASAESKKKVDVAVAEAVEEEQESKLPMKWFVIHTYSGHENKVKENIQKMVKTSNVKDQFGRLIVPTEEVAEMRKGKKTITTRKFFPSYILIEMFMSEDSWHLVNDIPGVTSFVGTGTKPQPLAEPEVERILGRMDKERDTIAPEIPFTLGEHIRIKDGPFSDFTGIIDEINTEKGKLRVLVSIFGRETPVELDFLQVESI